MKKLFLIFLLQCILVSASGQKYMTKTGFIGFYSHTPIEDIKAENHQVASILDASTGDIVFQVLMRSFKFPKALMEEHFNENYVESEKYPRSTFSGKILNYKDVDFSKAGKYPVKVEGDLTIHNVTKKINTDGIIEVQDGNINASTKFILSPEDYNISIPHVVRENIAKTIEVTVETKYDQTVKN
jgi:hypothetical protein